MKKTIYQKSLAYMPYAQCGVNIMSDGTVVFVSYVTPVIYITPEGWLICTGTYSPTTRKQIGRFLKEYVPALSYQNVKMAYLEGYKINIYTMEIEPL